MLSVTIIMLGILVYFSIIGFNLNPSRDVHVQKVVEIESFENNDNDNDNDNDNRTQTSFCKTHEGDRNNLQNSCSKLTKNNCLATSCCVYALMDGREQCHSGDINGPTFKRDDNGKTKDIDYYYYRNKCFGSKCE